jgi:hypothetical protein
MRRFLALTGGVPAGDVAGGLRKRNRPAGMVRPTGRAGLAFDTWDICQSGSQRRPVNRENERFGKTSGAQVLWRNHIAARQQKPRLEGGAGADADGDRDQAASAL